MHFTTKSEKELDVNNSLPCDTLTFMEHVYSPHSTGSLPCFQFMSSAEKIQSEMKSSELSDCRADTVGYKCLCKQHPCTPVHFYEAQCPSHMACPAAALHKSEAHPIVPPTFYPTGINPPTHRLLQGPPPGPSRHETSRGNLSLRKVRKVTDPVDG